ncbi:MAG: polyamine aminopropyltransferase [Candidatus Aminicenantales bacterium]
MIPEHPGSKRRSRRSKVIWEDQTPTSGLFFRVKKWLRQENSPYQKIEVIENESYGRVLFLDRLIQTTEADEFFYHEMLVHPALHCHPAPDRVLIIGGGDGAALRETLKHQVKKVSLVEIDGAVVEAAKKFFPWLEAALNDKRSELIIGDGHQYVMTTKEKFDVILVDSSDPVGPSAVLHQKDFFEKLKSKLKPRGIIAGQSGSAFFHREAVRQKGEFLRTIFRYAYFYLGPVPTYPGGLWCYYFLSDRINPLRGPAKPVVKGLKYYSREIHQAAFVLPPYLS